MRRLWGSLTNLPLAESTVVGCQGAGALVARWTFLAPVSTPLRSQALQAWEAAFLAVLNSASKASLTLWRNSLILQPRLGGQGRSDEEKHKSKEASKRGRCMP